MDAKLILFDVDGTLVDTAGAGRQAAEESFLRVFGTSETAEASRRVPFQGKTDPVIFEEMGRALGLEGDGFRSRWDELVRVYLESLERILSRPDPRRRVLPGVIALLETLSLHPSARLGLLTGNMKPGARAKLSIFDLNRFFPDGGFGSDHRDRRVIARLATEKLSRLYDLSFDPSSTFVVGDTEHDVDCARANGYRAVAVDTGFSTREKLKASAPDVLLDDLSDLDATLAALDLA